MQKLLAFTAPGRYGDLYSTIIYTDKIKQEDVIKLTVDGYVIYLYKTVFKEPYPSDPTPEQIEKINAIWEALGQPEKKIPT
jgi:hypothetical protein